ncbi:hypothetical protein [Fodinicola acaciae]|uniref:hypothetical protein n=1 Tax=Fodinicola acaciae TaxID=2681555 RepID=UPI0013D475C5|nr:hypothetical protein [Fodinicola acaciae]
MNPRQRLLDRIGDINDVDRPRPLVTLAEFFDGNDDPASIGYNLPAPPAPAEFAELLSSIARRDDVIDVRIEVKDLEDPDGWPSSDSIWIFTTADLSTVQKWFPERFVPDEWHLVTELEETTEPYQIPAGAHGIHAWYD